MLQRRILVTGGSGFLGRHVVPQLIDAGHRVIVPTRRRERARQLILLPGCEVIQADVHDADTLAGLVQGAHAVINLVGVLHGGRGDPYGSGFARAHVELPRRLASLVAALPRDAHPTRLVHVSALGVPDDGRRAASMYLRSKADGERAVRETRGLDWVVMRPSVVFGPDDAFLNRFARLASIFPVLPVARADARFAPVYVVDVARAIVRAAVAPQVVGRTYELAGPEVLTLAELVRFAARAAGHPRRVVALPDALGRLQAALMELAPGEPILTRDNLDSMSVPNVPTDPARVFPPELGVTPSRMTAVVPTYLHSRDEQLSAYRARARR